jgi:hypothetical protein
MNVLPDIRSLGRPLGKPLARLTAGIRINGRIARAFDRLKARIAVALTYGGRIALFVLIAIGGGYGSAWYMSTNPSPLTAERQGSWVTWTAAGRTDADPYTRWRFAHLGALPLNANAVTVYEARTDSDGRRLQSACDYAIEGAEPQSQWWSLAVFDQWGRLIPNPSDRYAFNSANITRNLDGTIAITIARDARPGNWLPVGAGGRLTLTLTLYGALQDAPAGDIGAPERPPLPVIRRLQCA